MTLLATLKSLLGLHDVFAGPDTTVGVLRSRVAKSYGVRLRVFQGQHVGIADRVAADSERLGALGDPRAPSFRGISLQHGATVRAVERAFLEKLGLGVQVVMPDGETFADDSWTLSQVAAFVRGPELAAVAGPASDLDVVPAGHFLDAGDGDPGENEEELEPASGEKSGGIDSNAPVFPQPAFTRTPAKRRKRRWSIKVSSNLTVHQFKSRFVRAFGVQLRLYHNEFVAAEDALLAELGCPEGPDFAFEVCHGNTFVRTLEHKFLELAGVRIELLDREGNFAPDRMTYATLRDAPELSHGAEVS